jgi:hypothetical protein
MNCFVSQRNIPAGLFVDTFSVFGPGRIVRLPVTLGSRRVAGATVGALPSLCVYVIATAEEGPEQRNLLRGAELAPVRCRLNWSLRRPRNGPRSNAALSEQTPEPSVFLRQLAALTAEGVDFGALKLISLHQFIIHQRTIALHSRCNASRPQLRCLGRVEAPSKLLYSVSSFFSLSNNLGNLLFARQATQESSADGVVEQFWLSRRAGVLLSGRMPTALDCRGVGRSA